MNTQVTRVTREEAALLAGVSPRQISRWSAAGLLTAEHGPIGARVPATYDPQELEGAAWRWKEMLKEAREVQLPPD